MKQKFFFDICVKIEEIFVSSRFRIPFALRALIVIWVLALLGWPTVVSAQPRTFKVQVTDQHGKPVSDATVMPIDWGAGPPLLAIDPFKSDEGGEATFENVSFKGHAYLIIKHTDYAPVTRHIANTGSDIESIAITLSPPVLHEVLVTDPDGNPIRGAKFSRLAIENSRFSGKYFIAPDLLKF